MEKNEGIENFRAGGSSLTALSLLEWAGGVEITRRTNLRAATLRFSGAPFVRFLHPGRFYRGAPDGFAEVRSLTLLFIVRSTLTETIHPP